MKNVLLTMLVIFVFFMLGSCAIRMVTIDDVPVNMKLQIENDAIEKYEQLILPLKIKGAYNNGYEKGIEKGQDIGKEIGKLEIESKYEKILKDVYIKKGQ